MKLFRHRVPEGYEAAVLAWLCDMGDGRVAGEMGGALLVTDGFAGGYRVWSIADNGGELHIGAVNDPASFVSVPYEIHPDGFPKAIALACRLHQAMRGNPITYDDEVFRGLAIAEAPGDWSRPRADAPLTNAKSKSPSLT